MNIKVDISEVQAGLKLYGAKAQNAAQKAMRDTVVLIANDVIKIHPWKTRTGNNSRSIAYGVGGRTVREGTPVEGKQFNPLEQPPGALKGSIYSTSGYGGILETGSRFMRAYPYFKPALDKNFPKFSGIMKAYLH